MKQILEASPACLRKSKELYEEKKMSSGRIPNPSEYLTLIMSFLSEFEEVSIIVDALDEAAEGDDIMDALIKIRARKNIPIRVLFSSRFDIRIERKYTNIRWYRVVLAENSRDDIELYVEEELTRRVNKAAIKPRNRNLVQTIQSEICLRAGT